MEFAAQLKSQVDIVSVVREYVPSLKKQGVRWVAPCPFHQEKTPSFGVHPVHQFYKCFGCGAGGDVINFVMQMEGMTFWEAVTHLAERHGIPLPKKSQYADEETKLRAALYEMHELAHQAFRQALAGDRGAAARAYIDQRRILPETSMEFGLGLADRGGQMLVRLFERHRFPADQMEASGLVMKRQDGPGWFDRFRGRLIFPIQNESGKIIAFAGRAMAADEQPKYMNSPETPIYRKSAVLYNLHRARKDIRQHDRSLLVEGYMDVIGLYQAGVEEAVASCGTALTDDQVRILRRHSDKIVVNFDPDAAGSNAAQRSVQMLLQEGMHVRVLQLPGGLDPDEFVGEHGPEAYRSQLQHAPDCFHWLADRARAQFDMTSAEGRVEGFRQLLLPMIERLPTQLERAAVAEEVAHYLRVEPALVRSEFRRLGATQQSARPPAPSSGIHPKEKVFVNLLLNDVEARREVIPRIKNLASIEQFRTWPLLAIMIQLQDGGEDWGYADVEGRLADSGKILLAEVVFADALGEPQASLEQALAFLPQLEHQDRQTRMAELKTRIRKAEQDGNLDEAIRLWEQYQESGVE